MATVVQTVDVLVDFSRVILAKAKHHAKQIAPLLDTLLLSTLRRADARSAFILVNQMRFMFRSKLFKLKYVHEVTGVVLCQVLGTMEGPFLLVLDGTVDPNDVDDLLKAALIKATTAKAA